MHDPMTLTAIEAHVDALLRFENFDRYREQSANTNTGTAAEIAPRQKLSPARSLTALPSRQGVGSSSEE